MTYYQLKPKTYNFMSQTKKNSPSDKDVFVKVIKELSQLKEDDSVYVLIGYGGGQRHIGIKGKGGDIGDMICDTFSNPENETMDALGVVIMAAMAGAMLQNDKLFGVADHLIEKAGEMRVRNVMNKNETAS